MKLFLSGTNEGNVCFYDPHSDETFYEEKSDDDVDVDRYSDMEKNNHNFAANDSKYTQHVIKLSLSLNLKYST